MKKNLPAKITPEEKKSLEGFMSDSRLVQLCEAQRTGDEVLDVINLSENQHSDILAWLFDAKEGHGQGDEILRDLLTYATSAANETDCPLVKNSPTKRFFADWSPSKLRCTSLGAAFSARELGMEASQRVDLFVIEPHNEFMLIIENKAGASHSEKQLAKYWDAFEAKVKKTPGLRKFKRIYIALDRELDESDAETRPGASQWLHLSYDWLKTSAQRASQHVERGNAAASLVVSYCNRQTDWENPHQEPSLQQAFELYRAYPDAVKYLVDKYKRTSAMTWLESADSQDMYSLFLLQNKGVASILKETQGMATVRADVLKNFPLLGPENVRSKRVVVSICPSGWELYANDKNTWPVYLAVRWTDSTEKFFKLILWWRSSKAHTPEEANGLRKRLIVGYPEFAKQPLSARRRYVIAKSLSPSELLTHIAKNLKIVEGL